MKICKNKVFEFIDLRSLAAACLSYYLWQLSMKIENHPIHVPQNDSNVNFPVVKSEVFPRNTLDTIVFVAFNVIIVLVYILQFFLPKIFKKINLMTAIWTEITCISVSSIITCLAKGYVGWPRPTMYAVCGYNATYETCKVKGKKREKQFISWPSSHATLACSAGIFMTCFIQSCFCG